MKKKYPFVSQNLQDSGIPIMMNVALVTILVKDLPKFPGIMAVVDVGMLVIYSNTNKYRTIAYIQLNLTHGLELLKDACVNVKYSAFCLHGKCQVPLNKF